MPPLDSVTFFCELGRDRGAVTFTECSAVSVSPTRVPVSTTSTYVRAADASHLWTPHQSTENNICSVHFSDASQVYRITRIRSLLV